MLKTIFYTLFPFLFPNVEPQIRDVIWCDSNGVEISQSSLSDDIEIRATTEWVAWGDKIRFDIRTDDRDTIGLRLICKVNHRGIARKKLSLSDMNDEFPKTIPHTPPQFKGGDVELFEKWKETEKRDNSRLKKGDQSGDIHMAFVVKKDGEVGQMRIIISESSDDPYLSYEAYRVMENSPRWEPALDKDGKPIDVSLTTIFRFEE